jgi:hypothetical protein
LWLQHQCRTDTAAAEFYIRLLKVDLLQKKYQFFEEQVVQPSLIKRRSFYHGLQSDSELGLEVMHNLLRSDFVIFRGIMLEIIGIE